MVDAVSGLLVVVDPSRERAIAHLNRMIEQLSADHDAEDASPLRDLLSLLDGVPAT